MDTADCATSAYNKDEVSRRISNQNLESCKPESFAEALHNPEIASSYICCNEDNSMYTVNPSFPSDLDEKYCYIPIDVNILQPDQLDFANNYSTTATTSSSTTSITSATLADTSNLSIVFDCEQEFDNDISVSIDFFPSPSFSTPQYLDSIQHDQPSFTSQLLTNVSEFSQYPADIMLPLMASHLQPLYEKDCSFSIPQFLHPNPQAASCSGLYFSRESLFAGSTNAVLDPEYPGLFNGNILVGEELQATELDYPAEDIGIFITNHLRSLCNSGGIQAICDENQLAASGAASSTPSGPEKATTEKVAKLSVEERKQKIHRYMKKRNERNFNKKIKYACRKTLADRRPRVRGRFAKSDDFGGSHRQTGDPYEEDENDEVTAKVDGLMDLTDIYAPIDVFNSFKSGYPIQYWHS